MKSAIIICSRSNSSRVPNKPFVKINGKPIIEHLIDRLMPTGLDVILSVPDSDSIKFLYLQSKKNVYVHATKDFAEDPLNRMAEHARVNGIDTIVRVTHDKILVEADKIVEALEQFKKDGADYLYGTKFVPGSGFEIISNEIIQEAASKWKNVEFISYAARNLCSRPIVFNPGVTSRNTDCRFLIDFPEDVVLLEIVFSRLGNNATLGQCIKFVNDNLEFKAINHQPILTVYTCAHNAEEWIDRAMASVARQVGFSRAEYILVDDFSTDNTLDKIARFCLRNENAWWVKNQKNLGLASSSNVALKAARGKYILRLDADDYLVSTTALRDLINEIDKSGNEVIYPNNYFGSLTKTQKGKDGLHCGGAIFDKRALNHLMFTDGLRGFEGLDLFKRAETQLKIGYLDQCTFFYTQRPGSMSKINLQEREKIKKEILEAYN